MGSNSYHAWLQYENNALNQERNAADCWWLHNIVALDLPNEGPGSVALSEIVSAVRSMFRLEPQVMQQLAGDPCLILGTVHSQWPSSLAERISSLNLEKDAYAIEHVRDTAGDRLILVGGSDRGLLYGAFALLRLVGLKQDLTDVRITEKPRAMLRMINQWDNADGSIERGYAGQSIFYENGQIVSELSRVRDYARLLASVGINAISINNVNVHEIETKFITNELLPDVGRVADVLRDYGIQLFLSINFAAPMQIGGLSTADPLDAGVQSWWCERVSEIYRTIPDFGGFLVKADSEHRPGPFTYERDHADGANMLAEALEPHGGVVIWRCFVYNCMQDWRDRSTDRARAAYDHFKPLDGRFSDNVILQIKNGPMDFQVREPVSPLFGVMERTNLLMEFQITQEYTGQQRHLCYLVPQWKEVLEFDTYAHAEDTAVSEGSTKGERSAVGKDSTKGERSTIQRIVDGSLFGAKYGGYAAVSNIGNDHNWTGHVLAQANLYGYGRLVWNPDLSAEEIAEEWVRLTFGNDDEVVAIICGMLMRSWPIYERYTAPLGVGWMVTPHTHYGPDVDGYEYSRWGTYHFADRDGIGVDRTVATGTGYTAQYHSPNAEMYESLERCPDELLLFFHHVPYSHRLKSGETVIQHIYNTHFEGAEEAEQLAEDWSRLQGKIDEERFVQVQQRLQEQAEHAKHWRDVINTYFYRKSGVPDRQGRMIY